MKVGIVAESPKLLEFDICGIRKPDFLSTDGSGWKNFGK